MASSPSQGIIVASKGSIVARVQLSIKNCILTYLNLLRPTSPPCNRIHLAPVAGSKQAEYSFYMYAAFFLVPTRRRTHYPQ